MGAQKLLLDVAGRPLLARTVDRVALLTGQAPLVVVPPDGAVAALALREGWRTAVNPAPADGMASSLKIAVGVGAKGQVPLLVFLGDQPDVEEEAVRCVLAAPRGRERVLAVQPFYRGTPSHPVLLFPGMFPALMTLRGDSGARSVLETLDAEELLVVPFDRPPPLDIDTPDDYAALRDRDGGGGARR